MKEAFGPITDELLKDGQFLCLVLPTTDKNLSVYTLQILRDVWITKDITEMQEVAPAGTVALDKLGESGHADQVTDEGDSVYRLDKKIDEKRLYHFGQLWDPEDFKIWFENPHDKMAVGWTRDIEVAVGDDEGYIWSDNTKYAEKMPSTRMETFILPSTTVYIGFENASMKANAPKGFFLGKAYDIEVVNSIDMKLAKDIFMGRSKLGYKRTVKTFGPLDVFKLSGLPSSWNDGVCVTPTEMLNVINTSKGGV